MTRSLRKDVVRTPPHDTTSLSEILHARVGEILADHPDVRHDWNADRTHFVFPAESEMGFDVEIVVGRDELIVAARGAHEHFHLEEAGGAVDACEYALGLVRNLLSPQTCRMWPASTLGAEVKAYGWSPEELAYQHPHLTLAEVHSALAYYWDHGEELDVDRAVTEGLRLLATVRPRSGRQNLIE